MDWQKEATSLICSAAPRTTRRSPGTARRSPELVPRAGGAPNERVARGEACRTFPTEASGAFALGAVGPVAVRPGDRLTQGRGGPATPAIKSWPTSLRDPAFIRVLPSLPRLTNGTARCGHAYPTNAPWQSTDRRHAFQLRRLRPADERLRPNPPPRLGLIFGQAPKPRKRRAWSCQRRPGGSIRRRSAFGALGERPAQNRAILRPLLAGIALRR
jgi:hypothetical protein